MRCLGRSLVLGETKNLATVMPDKAQALHARLVSWRTEVNAPMPMKNSPAGSARERKH